MMANASVKGFILSQVTAINYSNLYTFIETGATKNNYGLSFRDFESPTRAESEFWHVNTINDCIIECDIENLDNRYGFLSNGIQWVNRPNEGSPGLGAYILRFDAPSILPIKNIVENFDAGSIDISSYVVCSKQTDDYGNAYLSVTNDTTVTTGTIYIPISTDVLSKYDGYITAYMTYQSNNARQPVFTATKDGVAVSVVDANSNNYSAYKTPTELYPGIYTRVSHFDLSDFASASQIKIGMRFPKSISAADDLRIYSFGLLVGYQSAGKLINKGL